MPSVSTERLTETTTDGRRSLQEQVLHRGNLLLSVSFVGVGFWILLRYMEWMGLI